MRKPVHGSKMPYEISQEPPDHLRLSLAQIVFQGPLRSWPQQAAQMILTVLGLRLYLSMPLWLSRPVPRTSLNTSGSPQCYTWAGLPRYKQTGWEIFTGRVSIATRGKPYPLAEIMALACTWVFPHPAPQPGPSPPVVQPLNCCPFSVVMECQCPCKASPCQLPEGRSDWSGHQFRKDLRHPQKSSSGRWLRRAKGFSEIGRRVMGVAQERRGGISRNGAPLTQASPSQTSHSRMSLPKMDM